MAFSQMRLIQSGKRFLGTEQKDKEEKSIQEKYLLHE